jgi:hypothetical protein
VQLKRPQVDLNPKMPASRRSLGRNRGVIFTAASGGPKVTGIRRCHE